MDKHHTGSEAYISTIISTHLPVSFFLRMRLAVILLHGSCHNQSTVSGHGLVRSVGEPNGGPSMVHSDRMWSAVCSGAPHRQAAEGRRLQRPVTLLFDVHAPGSHLVEADHHWAPLPLSSFICAWWYKNNFKLFTAIFYYSFYVVGTRYTEESMAG